MKVKVEVYANHKAFSDGAAPIHQYVMNHNDTHQRRVLGEQCRNAFEGGQVIVTYPVDSAYG